MLGLDESIVKPFMGRLLREDLFHAMCVHTVMIATDVRITIDCPSASAGDAANEQAKPEQTPWAKVRPLVYEILRNSAKPKSVKIVFSHANAEEIHQNAKALFLNMTYESGAVVFTTGSAQKNFDLDKSMDRAWEEHVMRFFSDAGVLVVQM